MNDTTEAIIHLTDQVVTDAVTFPAGTDRNVKPTQPNPGLSGPMRIMRRISAL